MGVLSTYFHREIVPSYTRYRLRWTYTLRADDDGDFNTCHALYLHDNMEEIKALEVNFNGLYKHETEEGRAHVLSYMFSEENGDIHESEKYNLILEFDNRTGTTELTKEKVLLSVCTMDYVGNDNRFHLWTGFKNYSLVRDTYYYKYLTFNANGGVGTMSGQEIENSGKLNTARFHRSGYTFQGWAKTPNGAVVYADGAEITATETDKGPVTLYAVWKADPANVVAMINTIGEVVYTAECKARIDAARAVYDALSAEDKALVTNYSVLQAAENTYAAVKDVVTKINAIGSVSYPGSGTAITTAQTAYDALTAEQKAIVINIGVLSTAQDQYAILGVANQINAIGSVTYPESGTAIAAARTAYDALSAGQKTLVANYGTLTAAETAYQQAKADVGNTTINFVDKDETSLRNQKRTLNYPAAPEVENYVFQYWQTVEGNLSEGNLIVKAVYAPLGGNITLSDNADNRTLISDAHGQVVNVTLSDRTLSKDQWNTVCLPFDVDLTKDGPLMGVTAKTLSSVVNDGSTVTLTFGEAVTSLAAGTPYIVKLPEEATENLVNPLFEGATISNELHDVAAGDGTFKGTYARVDWSAGTKNVLFLQGNKFYYPKDAAWVNPFRGYIQLTTPLSVSAKVVLDFGDDNASGIETVDADAQLSTVNSQQEDVWYTLQGVQLDSKPTEKGIYILNGRKVAIQ